MADTTTPNLALIKPAIGASDDSWGDKTNDNWDKVDAGVAVKSKSNVFTASQVIQVTGANSAMLTLRADAGQARGIQFQTGTLARFQLNVDSTAESGANVGSDLVLYRYSDAGANIGTVFSVDRASGLMTIPTLQATSLNIGNADTAITRSAAGVIAVEGGTVPKENRGNTFTVSQTVQVAGGVASINIGSDAGETAALALRTGALNRWAIFKSAGAEAGANAGSDFQINRCGDDGVAINSALIIERKTGNVAIYPQADQTPASNVGHFVIRGASYAGGLSLDTDGLWLSHNSAVRALIFGINHVEAGRFASYGTFMVGRTTSAAGTEGFWVAKTGITRSDLVGTNSSSINKTNTDGAVLIFQRAQTGVGSISVTTTATAFNTTSDYRIKENVTPIHDATTRLMALRPSRFNFIHEPSRTVDGFIAHEAQEVVPESVTGQKDAVRVITEDEATPELRVGTTVPDLQAIDQSKLVPLLTAALQEAIRRIEALEAK